jgi:hypothetical protein
MNQLTAEEVHYSNYEFVGWKAERSDQMGFKTNHSGVVGGRKIYLRNCGH